MRTHLKTRKLLLLGAVVSLGLVISVGGVLGQSGPAPSASGTGQNDDQGVLLTFSATDHTRPGDLAPRYTGIAKERDLLTGATITIDINCMQVFDNVAIMSGPVIRATDVILVGIDMVFVVADNGEGTGAPPDLFSRFQPLTKGTCSTVKLGYPAIQSQRGNIQVRGSSAQ